MAINLVCSNCYSNQSLRKIHSCLKCGQVSGKNNRKYRVILSLPDGKRHTKLFSSISLAQKYELKIKTQLLSGSLIGIKPKCDLDTVWDKYLSWAVSHKRSWRADQTRWQIHVLPVLSGKTMDSVTPYDVQSVLDRMRERRNYAPATIKQVLVLIRRVYNWAREMGLYEGENPALRIKPPKVSNEVTECLTRSEVQRLLTVLKRWPNRVAANLISFALFTGLRRGELFNLRWENIDFINKTVALKKTKSGKDYILPISEKAFSILLDTRDLPVPSESIYVFPNRFGNKRASIANSWRRIKTKADLPSSFRFHGLRHTFASHLASSGKVSLYTLQALLTHNSIEMTKRYAHLLDSTLRRSTNLLPSLYNR